VSAELRVRQEEEADDFATRWVLEGAGSGVAREFRVLATATALAWIFLCERERGQGTTHPPAILRFRRVRNQFDVGDRSPALENAAYLYKALFDPASSDMPLDMIPQQAFDWTAQRMETLFPVR
jgi:hypothetical protein